MTDFNSIQWQSPTGASLAVRHLPAVAAPKTKAKAIVHINHGMAEHAARYERFAKALSAAGYHVFAHDHRGHGQTTAADAPLGVFVAAKGLDKALADMHFINQQIRENHPGLLVVLFGHSMGSILGINYCIRHSETIDGAALWNFNVDSGLLPAVFEMLLKIERAFKGSDVPSALAMKLTFDDWNAKFKPNRTGFDWLSRDEAEVDKYIADPLCGFPVSVGMWLNVVEAVRTAGRNANLEKIRKDLPVNLLGGEADPCSTYAKSMIRLADRLRKSGLVDVSCTTLPDTRHETLNEINRDEATAGLIGWLDERFG